MELAGPSPRFVQPTTDAPGPAADVFLAARREGFVELWSRREARLVERLVGSMPGWTIRAARVATDRSRFLYMDEHRVLWTRALSDRAPQRVDALTGQAAIVWVGDVLGEHVIVDALGGVYVWHGPGAVVDAIVEQSATHQALAAAVVGDELAIGYDSGDIAIVDPRRGLERTLHGHVGGVFALAAAGHGDKLTLTSASRDGTIREWRMMPAGATAIALGAARVSSVAVTRNGTVAAGGEDGVVRLWKPGTPATVLDRAFIAREMVLSPDDRYLVWSRGPTQGGVRLADLGVADHPRFDLQGCGRYPRFAASAARFACVRNFDGATLLWNTDTWTPIAVGAMESVQVDSLSLSPNGTQVVSGRLEEGADLRLWDTRSGAARILSRIHGNVVASAFRPGGNDVITGDLARRVRWFRLGDGTAALLDEEAPRSARSSPARASSRPARTMAWLPSGTSSAGWPCTCGHRAPTPVRSWICGSRPTRPCWSRATSAARWSSGTSRAASACRCPATSAPSACRATAASSRSAMTAATCGA